MTRESWQRLKKSFGDALDLDESAREEFANAVCAEDPAMGAELRRLLGIEHQARQFFAATRSRPVASATPERSFRDDALVCGRFRIVRLIGSGGMGEVYEATDQLIGGSVALKTVRADIAGEEGMGARFLKEVQLARQITHPNVCRIHDLFTHSEAGREGAPPQEVQFLSMELLRGETLADHLRSRGRMSAAECASIVRQAAAGLEAAHRVGIVHRDFKSANVVLVSDAGSAIVDAEVRAVITDFGLARKTASEDYRTAVSEHALVAGTPAYMAPEQVEGGRITPATDIYALGVVWFEMATGTLPFTADTPWQTALRRLAVPPRPPRELAPDLDPRQEAGILKCMQKDPAGRFDRAGRILDFLDAPEGTEFQFPAPKPRTRWRRHWRGMAAALVGSVALFAAASRYTSWNSRIPAGSSVLLTQVQTADPELEGVTSALRSQLAQSAHFTLVEESRARELLQQMLRKPDSPMDAATARELALREGAPVVIFGSVSALGQEYVLQVKVERVGYTPWLVPKSWKHEFSASGKQEMFEAVHRTANWIRDAVGEAINDRAEQDRRTEDTTTSSWQALQLLTRADERAASGRGEEAVLLMQEALRLDPDFAMAHMRLGDLLISQKRYSEGYPHWQQALRLTEKRQLTSREQLRIRGQYNEDTGDFAGAEKAYRTFAVHYPNDYLPLFLLGSSLADMGRDEEAVRWFTEAAAKKPRSFAPLAHKATLLMDLKRFDEAKAEIAHVRSLGQSEYAVWLDALAEFAQGRIGGAIDRLTPLQTSASDWWRSREPVARACWLAEAGHDLEAIAALQQGVQWDVARGFREREADKHLLLAQLYLRQRQLAQTRAECRRALALEASPIRSMRAGSLLARAGWVNEARKLRADMRQQPDIPQIRMAQQRLEGEIALAEGRTASAISDLRMAAKLARPRETRDYLARALARANHTSEALELYREIAARPVRLYLSPDAESPGLWTEAQQFLERANHTTVGEKKND